MSNPVLFNAYDLDGITGFEITDYDFNIYPNRQLRTFKLANQNRSALTSAEYVEKAINVYGIIRNCTREDAEATLSVLRSYTQGIKKVLSVPQYNRQVEYTATLQEMSQTWHGNNMQVVMGFYCDEPTGVDNISEALIAVIDQTVTTATDTFPVVFAGSSLEQYPVITIVINSLTGGTNKTITIDNDSNSHEVAIQRTWIVGDDLEIDTYNKTVKVNSSPVEYTGRIPDFNTGATNILYQDTLTTRNVTITATYQRRYV